MRKTREAMSDMSGHVHPIVRQVMHELLARKMTLTDIADLSGVSGQSIGGWKYDISPKLANIEAVANALGYRVALVPIESQATPIGASVSGAGPGGRQVESPFAPAGQTSQVAP